MKVTIRDCTYSTDDGDKVLQIESVQYTSDTVAIQGLRRFLRAAQTVWPNELGNYEIRLKPTKKRK